MFYDEYSTETFTTIVNKYLDAEFVQPVAAQIEDMFKVQINQRNSPFLNNPVADSALGAIVIHTHLVQSLAFSRIWNKITLVIYLLQGLLGRTIIFQFEHIDGCRKMEYGISPAYGTILFHLDKSTHQIEYQIENSLKITFILIAQTIRYTREICLQTNHRLFNIPIINQLHKLIHQSVVIHRYWRKIIGRKTLQHPNLHLLVRIPQLITLGERLILLDGEITTLIKQRQG